MALVSIEVFFDGQYIKGSFFYACVKCYPENGIVCHGEYVLTLVRKCIPVQFSAMHVCLVTRAIKFKWLLSQKGFSSIDSGDQSVQIAGIAMLLKLCLMNFAMPMFYKSS